MKEIDFKLNKPAYGISDVVRVQCKYNRDKGGYVASAELISKSETELFTKEFTAEYYKSGGDFYELVVPCKRISQKKNKEAVDIICKNAMMYAEIFIKNVADNLGIEGLEIV